MGCQGFDRLCLQAQLLAHLRHSSSDSDDDSSEPDTMSLPSDEEIYLQAAATGPGGSGREAADAARPFGEGSPERRVRFDPSAATRHSYLGDVSDLSHVAGAAGYLEEGSTVKLPLIPLPGECQGLWLWMQAGVRIDPRFGVRRPVH